MTPLKCIAVDDEPLALGLLASFIEQTPFLTLTGRYSSGVEALRSLHEHPDVDLLFLDIQMPELTGMELARVLDRGQPGSGPRIRAIRLPRSPCSSAARIETGTSARSSSPSVRMPRLCSHLRTDPVTTASTTSLTVPPSSSLIRLKVASSERAQT